MTCCCRFSWTTYSNFCIRSKLSIRPMPSTICIFIISRRCTTLTYPLDTIRISNRLFAYRVKLFFIVRIKYIITKIFCTFSRSSTLFLPDPMHWSLRSLLWLRHFSRSLYFFLLTAALILFLSVPIQKHSYHIRIFQQYHLYPTPPNTLCPFLYNGNFFCLIILF